MIKYCIFIIFGIILYLLLNTYNGFSIGIPNTYLLYYYHKNNPPYIQNIGLSHDPDDNQEGNTDILGQVTDNDVGTDY